MTKNILLSGVGGQGTITAAKMLTFGLMEAGYDVKMSEIHGMSPVSYTHLDVYKRQEQ